MGKSGQSEGGNEETLVGGSAGREGEMGGKEGRGRRKENEGVRMQGGW